MKKKTIINAIFQPILNNDIVEGSTHENVVLDVLGIELIAYKIKWFNGVWSTWFIPGVNDHYQKEDEPERTYVACFNDHEFELIGCI